jgi:hypothetical protein
MLTATLASIVVTATLLLQQFAITNVTVIDPEKGTATAGRVILLDGSRITGVAEQATVRRDGRMERIDGTGLFAFPGLIDSHVHLGDPATFGPLSIAHGVTAVRNMGGDTETVLALRDRFNKGETVGPRMIATGAIIDGAQPVWPFSEACATPEEGRAAVRKLKAAGVDQIKVYSKLEPEVYRAVVAEAKVVGLMAVGHVPASVTIEDAIAAGQATNEHLMRAEEFSAAALPADAPKPTRSGAAGGIFSSFGYWALYPQTDKAKRREALSRLAQPGMVQCPTLVVQQGIARAGDGSGERDERMASVSPAFSAFWKGDSYASYAAYERFDALRRQLEERSSPAVREALLEWQTVRPRGGAMRPLTGMIARIALREGRLAEAAELHCIAMTQVPEYTSWYLEYVYFKLAATERLTGTLTEFNKGEAARAIEIGRTPLAFGNSESGMTERYVGRLHQLRGEWKEAIQYLEAARGRMSGTDLVACDQALAISYKQAGRIADAKRLIDQGIAQSGQFEPLDRKMAETILGTDR